MIHFEVPDIHRFPLKTHAFKKRSAWSSFVILMASSRAVKTWDNVIHVETKVETQGWQPIGKAGNNIFEDSIKIYGYVK